MTDLTFSEWLDEALMQRGQGAGKWAADRIQTSTSNISRWRAGQIPEERWLAPIAAAFEIDEGELRSMVVAERRQRRNAVAHSPGRSTEELLPQSMKELERLESISAMFDGMLDQLVAMMPNFEHEGITAVPATQEMLETLRDAAAGIGDLGLLARELVAEIVELPPDVKNRLLALPLVVRLDEIIVLQERLNRFLDLVVVGDIATMPPPHILTYKEHGELLAAAHEGEGDPHDQEVGATVSRPRPDPEPEGP